MKNAQNSLFKLIAILFIFASVSGCREEGGTKPPQDETIALPEPDGIIGREEARKNYLRYKERRIALIQRYEDSIDRKGKDYQGQRQTDDNQDNSETTSMDSQRFIPAEFVNFPYDSIKKYMNYIEREAKLSGEEITSLRIYFSNNPAKETYPDDAKIVHPRQNSVMLSPTIERDDKEYIFFTVDEKEGKRRAMLLSDDFAEKEDQSKGSSNQGEQNKAGLLPNLWISRPKSPAPFFAPKSTTYNRGHGSPPNTNNQ